MDLRVLSRRDFLVRLPLLLPPSPFTAVATLPPRVEGQLQDLLREHHVPAIGFGYVRAGRVDTVLGLGYADIATKRLADADTVFHLASVSKVVTATALMQLHESGAFKLDDPIQPHVDFGVTNPRHAQPITFRHILTHTSSISDNNYTADLQGNGDPTLPLRDFLQGYLTPAGRWFSTTGSFTDAAPGERFLYSNVGAALAGYLAECISKTPLQQLTARTIFRPLGMNPAGWRLAELGHAPLATPYIERNGELVSIPQIGYPDWPAGLLRTTTRGITNFLAAYANGGRFGGARILRPDTVAAMITPIAPPPLPSGHVRAQGLFWEEFVSAGARIFGKSGTDAGAHNLIAFNPKTKDGVVLLTNRSTNDALNESMLRIVTTLLA